MKKITLLLFFIPLLFRNEIQAQGYIETFGLKTWATPQSKFSDKGWGGGLNFLGPQIPIIGKGDLHPIDIQFGPGLYMSSFGVKKFRDVPLIEPQTGNAKVSLYNLHLGVYGLVRFCSPNPSSEFMPYIDFIGGYRYVGGDLSVTPNNDLTGNSSTDTHLKNVSGFMYGAGAGMQVKLSDNANLDFELIWSYSPQSKDIVDINSAHRLNDGIFYNTKNSPNTIMLLKVGFNFRCEDDRGCSDENNSGSYHGGYYGGGMHSGNSSAHSSVHMSSGGHVGGAPHVITK